MNSLAVHRVIIALLAVAVIGLALWVGGARKDGDPSGLDIVSKGVVTLKVQPNNGGLLCLSGSSCDVQVEVHYLNSPTPDCPDSSSFGCTVAGQPRTLPSCHADYEDVCLSLAPATAPSPTPLTVYVQDADGLRQYDSNGEFIISLNALGAKPHKKP